MVYFIINRRRRGCGQYERDGRKLTAEESWIITKGRSYGRQEWLAKGQAKPGHKNKSDEMALASTLCVPKNAYLLRTDNLYSSAWSCRTGKRIRTSLKGSEEGLGSWEREQHTHNTQGERQTKPQSERKNVKTLLRGGLFGQLWKGPCAAKTPSRARCSTRFNVSCYIYIS